ncbi:MAG TPA: phosphoribosyltransferase family protein [Gaiellaceae bacterium]|nr:phosphoribosyltransferase family protein [Gaiellaceae bacterium]
MTRSPYAVPPSPLFRSREEAGRRLARALAAHGIRDGVVVGLARGGIVPAAEIARGLGLPLDVLAVRKIGHPRQPEYAIGAVTPGGGRFVRSAEGLGDEVLEAAVAEALARAEELDRVLHADVPALDPAGETVILADDGLATGATMRAAIRWARRAGAARVVVAVPVGPDETVEALGAEADEVVCLERPLFFGAVAFWYAEFGQVASEEVVSLLAAERRAV